ncbi:hypothetical protein VNO77_32891 [Canavalia gladiata]|uniref:Uncharacterized protein n=1 Tax=Canavalia gladiata TaxID=3824 RepID=A0AAN9KCU5_CANGL
MYNICRIQAPSCYANYVIYIFSATTFCCGSISYFTISWAETRLLTKFGGWVEMNKLNPKPLEWAVTVSDVSFIWEGFEF